MNHLFLGYVVLIVDSFVIFGLPAHILLVHAVVVLVPLTALAVLLHAVWPAARRRLGVVTPLAALIVLILVPITVSAGEALEATVGVTPAVQKHSDLGRTLLPWAIALFVIALVEWVWYRFVLGAAGADAGAAGSDAAAAAGDGDVGSSGAAPIGARMPRAGRVASVVVIAVAAVIIAGGAVIDIVLIGDAGARAVWGGIVGG